MRNQDGEMNSVPGYSLTGAGSGRVGDGETSEALGWLGHGDCPTGPRQGKGRGLAICADSGEWLGFGPWPRRVEKGFEFFYKPFIKSNSSDPNSNLNDA
jgi:hypothetical protein